MAEYNKMKQQELERSLRDVLKSVPVEYKDKKFSHIAVVARALKKSRPQDDLQELNRHYDSLNDAVSDIVDANYKGFNKSIRNFSDILSNLETSRKWVSDLENNIDVCEDLLVSRSDDLSQLYSTYLQHTEFLKILRMVEEVKGVPSMLQRAVKTKHYLYAVRQILKYEEMIQCEELKNIGALEDIKAFIKDLKTSLPDLLVDELSNHCFHHFANAADSLGSKEPGTRYRQSTAAAAASPSQQNVKKTPTTPASKSRPETPADDSFSESSKKIERNIRTRVRRMTLRSESAPRIDTLNHDERDAFAPHDTADQEEPLEDDPAMNVELDPSYFMQTVVEALNKLGHLAYAQNRLIQNLRSELNTLINDHVRLFAKSFAKSDIAWTLQNLNMTTGINSDDQSRIHNFGASEKKNLHFFKALLQGQPLMDMLKALFSKLSHVLHNFKSVIDIVSNKLSQQQRLGLNQPMQDNGLDDMKVTKDVISELRARILTRIEELRMQKRPNATYINALEDLLYNFLEQEDNKHVQGMKVSNLPKIFWGMLDTQARVNLKDDLTTRKRKLSEAQQDFKDLLQSSLSSLDTPRILTLENVWNTMQNELKTLLVDILGITKDEMNTQNEKARQSRGSVSKSKPHSQFGDKDGQSNEDKSRANRKALRFRFGRNIEYSANDTHTQESKVHLASASLNALVKFFTFSPYNLMWLFRPLMEYIDSIGDDMAAMMDTDENGVSINHSSLTSILRNFVDNAVKKSLLARLQGDYRAQLSQVLLQSDAFHPVNTLRNGIVSTEPDNGRGGTGRVCMNSAVQLAKWLAELMQFSVCIPPFRDDFFAVIEKLLHLYYEESKNQFRQLVASKYVRSCLDRSDIMPLLQSDPQWKRIYIDMINRQQTAVDEKIRGKSSGNEAFDEAYDMNSQLRNLLKELVDNDLLQMDVIERCLIIDDLPSITLLVTMNESLEWLTDQFVIVSRWSELQPSRKAEFISEIFEGLEDNFNGLGNQNQLAPFLRSTIETGELSNIIFNPFHLLMLQNQYDGTNISDSSNDLQHAGTEINTTQAFTRFASPKMEEFYRQFSDLANQCLFALKLDLRVQCFHYLDAIKRSVYLCEEEPAEPEPAVKLFNSELTRIDACMSKYLPFEKTSYVFGGIAELICDILVDSLSRMKHRRWNELGVVKMKKNIFALEQNITNITRTQRVQAHFNFASRYYDLLLLNEKDLFAHILEESNVAPFTFDQYRAVLETSSSWHESHSKERSITVLSELFEQKRMTRGQQLQGEEQQEDG